MLLLCEVLLLLLRVLLGLLFRVLLGLLLRVGLCVRQFRELVRPGRGQGRRRGGG